MLKLAYRLLQLVVSLGGRLDWHLRPTARTREELQAEGVAREIVVGRVRVERGPSVPAREEIAEGPDPSKRRRGEEINKHRLQAGEAPGQLHGPAASIRGDVRQRKVLVGPAGQAQGQGFPDKWASSMLLLSWESSITVSALIVAF